MLIKVQASVRIRSCIVINGHYSTVEDHQTNIYTNTLQASLLVASPLCSLRELDRTKPHKKKDKHVQIKTVTPRHNWRKFANPHQIVT